MSEFLSNSSNVVISKTNIVSATETANSYVFFSIDFTWIHVFYPMVSTDFVVFFSQAVIRGGLKSGSYKVDFVANSLAAQKHLVTFLMVGGDWKMFYNCYCWLIYVNIYIYTGWWFGTCFMDSISYGMSSFPLTNSYFSRW